MTDILIKDGVEYILFKVDTPEFYYSSEVGMPFSYRGTTPYERIYKSIIIDGKHYGYTPRVGTPQIPQHEYKENWH